MPTAHAPGKPRFFWFVMLAGTLALGGVVFAGSMIFRYGTLDKYGWEAIPHLDGWHINRINPQGPAADKLQVGDRILAINHDAWGIRLRPDYKLRSVPVGQTYTMRLERQGAEQEIELTVVFLRAPDYIRLGSIFTYLALGIAFYLMAMLSGLLKPEENIIRIAFGASFSMALYALSTSLFFIEALFTELEYNILFLMMIASGLHLFIPFSYHLYYRFPPGVPEGRFWTFLKWPLYAVGAILYVTYLSLNRMAHGGPAAFSFNPDSLYSIYWNATFSFVLIGLAAICAVMVRNYRLVKGYDQRNRIKWVIYGSIAAFLPFAIKLFIGFVFNAAIVNTPVAAVLNVIGLTPAVTWSYAVLKHRVFDLNVVIRRGLQYLLAKNMLRFILALPIIGAAYGIISNPNRTVADLLFQQPIYPILIVTAALSLKFRRQLSAWVDRQFFREAYNQEQILLRLIEEIKEFNSMTEISRLVSQQVTAALHPDRVYVFYREAEKRALRLGHSSSGFTNLTIPEEWHLLRLMESQARPQQFPFPTLPPEEQNWLNQLGINLLVPMRGTDERLIGLLLLGEKKSEQPYLPTDCKLLQAIAGQVAVVYENVRLKEHVDKEQKIKYEVLAHLETQHINLVKECPECGTCYDSSQTFCLKDDQTLTLSLPVERTIEGKYRLEELIGRGGMGIVYRATDLRLDRQVAIKIITGGLFGNRTALQRFEREARASARLNHPNIVATYDYGRAGAEGAYLVMELLYGFSLRLELARVGALPPRVAAAWFDQVLEGVKAAHQAGVVHRDLKPDNVLITGQEPDRPLIKVLDFGLAKLRSFENGAPSNLTAPGAMMGTLGYMSPEQLQGQEADERSDIFSLGVMVVEALTGGLPFAGKTYAAMLNAIIQQPYHLQNSAEEAQRLDAVLQKCLAKDGEQRYASVAELQRELIPAIEQCPPLAASAIAHSQDKTIIGHVGSDKVTSNE